LREASNAASSAQEARDADTDLLVASEEQAVVKQLARLPQAVREAGDKFLPAIVADATYTLAREFARFYHACPVLKAPTPELRAARLALVAAVAHGLKNGLALLGIQAPERM
jgi:arginyl-tRNA synthetase